MKKYMIVLLILGVICSNIAFAQGKAKHHKSMEHKSSRHHAVVHHAIPMRVHHAVAKHPSSTHHHSVAHHHNMVKHHGKHIARHHAVKHNAAPQGETIVIDDHLSTAVVEIKNGNVYVNDNHVFKIKSLKKEDDKIMIDNITPPPAPPAVIAGPDHSEDDNKMSNSGHEQKMKHSFCPESEAGSSHKTFIHGRWKWVPGDKQPADK